MAAGSRSQTAVRGYLGARVLCRPRLTVTAEGGGDGSLGSCA